MFGPSRILKFVEDVFTYDEPLRKDFEKKIFLKKVEKIKEFFVRLTFEKISLF